MTGRVPVIFSMDRAGRRGYSVENDRPRAGHSFDGSRRPARLFRCATFCMLR